MAYRRRHSKATYRSGLEDVTAERLKSLKIPVEYESFRIPFVQPSQNRHYTPDFILPNGVIIETKGEFNSADRKKHLLILEQHPVLDIRFVFSNAHNRIYKGSKTTYATWCKKHGFQYAHRGLPSAWVKEPKNHAALKKIKELKGDK